MAEDYVLDSPEVTPGTTNTKYKVVLVQMDMQLKYIQFRLTREVGGPIFASYGGPTSTPAEQDEAVAFMKFVNTANFSVNSMQKRILQKLEADGKIPPGEITGTPDV